MTESLMNCKATSPSQGHIETNNHPRSHSLLRSILSHQLTWHACFLGSENPQENLRKHGRTCKFRTERPLKLGGNSANHRNTLSKDHSFLILIFCPVPQILNIFWWLFAAYNSIFKGLTISQWRQYVEFAPQFLQIFQPLSIFISETLCLS